MSKCLTVVAMVLLVLTGAMGLRNIVVANASTITASNLSAPVIWANGPGPIPPIPPGTGGHFTANGPGPIPPIPPGTGGHFTANGPGPIPPIPPGTGGHFTANGPGPIPPIPPGTGGH
jgi:hypothetical protein